MILQQGTLVQNRYLVQKHIAHGGMGAVYKATDQKHNKTVALKQSLVKDPKLLKAFEREARILARLRHPVLPVVSNHFVDDNGQFLVMQYIPGDDLGTILERQAKKFLAANAIPWVLNWADQLLDALTYLHESQDYPIIHRDIKPQNLKITAKGEIKLLDFGLAKSAADHTMRSAVKSVRGYSAQYAPIEQMQGTGTEPCSDLYSLSATVYHLLTGIPPVDALERVAALLGGQKDPLRSAHEVNSLVPTSVSVVLQQAMEQEKDYRFASASAMRTALRMANQAKQTDQPKDDTGSSGMRTIVSAQDDVPAFVVQGAARISQPVQSGQGAAALDQPYPTLLVAKQGYGSHTSIGEAIRQAKPGTRIIIHPGVYREAILIDKTVEIVGDGPRDKIVVENVSGHVVKMQTDYALVRGLTLRGLVGPKNAAKDQSAAIAVIDIGTGRLVIEDCNIVSDTRVAVTIHGSSANPVLWRCKVSDSKGIGISFANQARGMIEECEISGHAISGVVMAQESNPIIRRCRIHHNKQDGVVVGEKSTGTVDDCDIFENVRIGIGIKQESNPFIRWCKVHEQINGYGIYVYENGEGVIESCNVFANNEAGIGITRGGNPFIRRCQIHREKQRGVVVVDNGLGIIESCDVFQNTKIGIAVGKHSNPMVRKCKIREGGQIGVFVWDNGTGTFEECDIVENAQAGVEIAAYGNPIIRKCNINRNRQSAIVARKESAGSVEESDLTDNRRGAWTTEDGSFVLGGENKE